MVKFESPTNGPDDDYEDSVIRRSDVPEKVREYLDFEYLRKSDGDLRLVIRRFSEFESMEEGELDLAVRIFSYVVGDIVNRFEKDLESFSREELADSFGEILESDQYDKQTISFVAGQVMSVVKRIISEKEKEY